MATDQQFCLRWNNHQSTLISVFDSLLENGTLVDCTLAAEGQSLKAHKVVLSACSPYLEALLSQHYEKHPIVILKDVKFSELKSMMDYMYRGEVNISQDQLGTFLKAAESLQIKGLSDNGDDARDVGSTNKKPDAPRPNVTQTRAPLESKRPAPLGDVSDTSRDGSISPSSLRKRRRTRRPSNGEDPENNLDNNVCDLPAAQSTPMPVPSAPVQSLPKQIVKTEPPPPMPDPVKKEILDPPAEPLLEPKTEYLDYMNNENSIEVEDLTLDDDDEDGMDSSMDASRPGPSHGDLSQGGYPPWTMTGDQSGTDEIFMAAQEAVGAASGQQQRDSQGRSAGKTEKVVFGKMVETDDGNISLIPIKIYEVESNISSQYKTISQKKTGDVEEVVVESLGPFTDAVTLTKKTWPTSEAKKSPTTLTPRPQTEAVTVTRKTWHTPEARKSPTTMTPVVVIKSIGSIPGQEMTTTPSQKKLEETNILSTPKLVSKLFDETVLENEDNEFESTDNDPDYEPEDFNPVIKKRKKTMDDFELDEETNQYKCKICKHTFKHKKSVNGHMKRDCKEKCTPKLTEYELDETTNKYICKVCGKSLKSLQTLMAHKRDICKREPKHECFFCDYKGRNPTVLRVHIGKAHGKWGQLNKDGTWSYL